ncbi:SEC10/PgrA surface exclusion domain-containing protein [Fructobacillus ficulneus]|uniref:Uncharacterized protein n=1 Tax=Fructobacillus ficulneus TaxID=157463 RepID=A0A0K8MK12_9LACO|nr:SEC10/PgrA surface exclusion domain-containing protein [Fructobacillus ficulneus]GAP00499.1 hypothetical protein FFIC_285180 [Fructobacillus ficulneus]
MFVHNTATLPTKLIDPMAGEANPDRTSDKNLIVYQDENDDSDHILDGEMTPAQLAEISNYFVTLLNDHRQSLGLNPVQLTTEGTQVAQFIKNFRDQYQVSWTHTPMFDLDTGQLFQTDAEKQADSQKFGQMVQSYGLDWKSEDMGMVANQSTPGYYTMAEMKSQIYAVLEQMIYDDEGSNNGHKKSLEDPTATYVTLDINDMHDAAQNQNFGGHNYDVIIEMMGALPNKMAADYHVIDPSSALTIINTARAKYGASQDELTQQSNLHAELAKVQAIVNLQTAVTQASDQTQTTAAALKQAQSEYQGLQENMNTIGSVEQVANPDLARNQDKLTQAQAALKAAQEQLTVLQKQLALDEQISAKLSTLTAQAQQLTTELASLQEQATTLSHQLDLDTKELQRRQLRLKQVEALTNIMIQPNQTTINSDNSDTNTSPGSAPQNTAKEVVASTDGDQKPTSERQPDSDSIQLANSAANDRGVMVSGDSQSEQGQASVETASDSPAKLNVGSRLALFGTGPLPNSGTDVSALAKTEATDPAKSQYRAVKYAHPQKGSQWRKDLLLGASAVVGLGILSFGTFWLRKG